MLHGDVSVNGRVVGRWRARRVRQGRYAWAYTAEGFEAHGVVDHREDDGPSVLASKVLGHARAPAKY